MVEVKKIVIIGPESTGKSVLAQSLAEELDSFWVDEYARKYLTEKGTDYKFEDLLAIAKGQVALEDSYLEKAQAEAKKFLIIDTNMYVMKIWCEYVFGKVHDYIEEQIEVRKYDLYLLPDINLPWQKDSLREYPDFEIRRELFTKYHSLLEQQAVPFGIVTGIDEMRTRNAMAIINNIASTRKWY